MSQNYRPQNESGRGPDYSRTGQRPSGGRDRYETGNERRYSPDWENRFYESGHEDDNGGSFAGDRSYSAGGYQEEFGYRRDTSAERERGGGRDEHLGGSYYDRAGSRYGKHPDYGRRDHGPGAMPHPQQQHHESQRYEPGRGEDFNRGRGGYFGFGQSGGSSNYGSSGMQGREATTERYPGSEDGRQQQSSFRGRGPKGYERSDERLREMICERLTDDPQIDASEVSVEVTNKVVKLTGSVEERRIKYQIEDVIEQCGGVRDIDNQLRVQSQGSQSQGSQSQGSQSQQYGTALPDTSFAARSPDKSTNPGSLNPTSTNPSPKRN